MDDMISPMSFSKGLEMGAISERLNAPIILTISMRFASLWFLLSYFTYSSKQFDIILKSCNFSFIF